MLALGRVGMSQAFLLGIILDSCPRENGTHSAYPSSSPRLSVRLAKFAQNNLFVKPKDVHSWLFFQRWIWPALPPA